jgi:hypothetical protein
MAGTVITTPLEHSVTEQQDADGVTVHTNPGPFILSSDRPRDLSK